MVLLCCIDDRADGLLDPQIHHGVAVVGEDDVDQVLADVVHITLHGCEHDGALAASVGLLQVRLEVGDRGLHHLGRLQHERQLHLAGPESSPTTRMPANRSELMISMAGLPSASAAQDHPTGPWPRRR